MGLEFQVKGLRLPELGLALDPHRPTTWAFVSHGHADHFARHEKILCSEGTGHILNKRYRVSKDRIQTLAWRQALEIKGHQIELFPAGHICGSAMIRVEKDGESLLYTGDFKTRDSLTAELPVFPQAHTLIMETTFGRPNFVFPPNEEIRDQIVDFTQSTLDDGEVPIILAYSLGKAQEAYAILTEAGISVVMTKPVVEMTRAFRELGIRDVPEPVLLEKSIPKGVAVIAPPSAVRSTVIRRCKNRRTAMLSGWALTPGSQYRYQVDAVFPLSDHADFPGLLEAVEKVNPKLVYTLHGSTREFAADLRDRGYEAWSIYGDDQLELLGKMTSTEQSIQEIPRPDCELRTFSELLEQLVTHPSRLKKISLIADFICERSNQEITWLINWLSGRGVTNLGHAIIRQALLDVSSQPLAHYKVLSSQQNDSARTARVILEASPLKPTAFSFVEVSENLTSLIELKGSLDKSRVLAAWLKKTHPREGETIIRLLTGGLRAGAKEGLLEEVIAEAFSAKPSAIREAVMLSGDLGTTAILAKENRLAEAQVTPSSPIKPMLAAPTEDSAELLSWHESLATDAPLWLEPKYDGIRAQLHVSADGVHLFSRDLRSLDGEFPEILSAAQNLPECILDGELIAYAEGKKLTFFDLQKRLGRKKVQGDLFFGASIPVRFVTFDCLHVKGQKGLIKSPLHMRRKALESLELSAPFSSIPVSRAKGIPDIEAEFKNALADDQEGLIAKDPESPYRPGRRGKSWRKLKGVMPTLDCVVIAAQQGHGKRAGLLSDYTFAVRDESSGDLRTLGKAYSGLTDEEIEELTDHFQQTTIEKLNRRVHAVEPTIVLEIAFDRIRPSKRHDSGLALRFPRIKAIRRDKSPCEIDTLQTTQKLVT
ncbi:MAG: ATP-dependent DNA ligase [Akkermansiaceae bacterium]